MFPLFPLRRENSSVFDMFPFSLEAASTSLIMSLELQLHKAAEVTEKGEEECGIELFAQQSPGKVLTVILGVSG